MQTGLRDLNLPAYGDVAAYIGCALLITLGVRLVLAVMKASERWECQQRSWGWCTIGVYCLGFGIGNRDCPDRGGGDDYLQPTIVGIGELLVYPMLMALRPEYVGAWLLFKVVPQLGTWSTARASYQRFLVGNGLVLVASYFMMRAYIPS